MSDPSTAVIFHRAALARNIADRALSAKGRSGLFIAAPRRTGKSTLIVEDILPYLAQKNAEVIYVDLWSDRSRDPAELIVQAVGAHLRAREGAILAWARKGGLDKVRLGGLELDVGKVGMGAGKTLASALAELSDATGNLIVLVVDEAQHALGTQAGAATLFALKAARDQLNGSAHHGFRLIATGSNRDKLSLLVRGKDQAFLNAALIDLAPLGDDYLAWELARYEGAAKPSMDALGRAFAAAGYQPETLAAALDELAFGTPSAPQQVDVVLLAAIDRILAEARRGFMHKVNSLPPLQAAVLAVMARAGADFAPFQAHTMEWYARACQSLAADGQRIDAASIQTALDTLCAKSLVWASSGGVYAIEDEQHAKWLAEQAASLR